MTDRESFSKTVKETFNQCFFEDLEDFLGFEIPKILQNILRLNSYDNDIAISKLDDSAIKEMEEFMVNDFEEITLAEGETKEDYLGIYAKTPKKFKFLSGQIKMLREISEKCKTLHTRPPEISYLKFRRFVKTPKCPHFEVNRG